MINYISHKTNIEQMIGFYKKDQQEAIKEISKLETKLNEFNKAYTLLEKKQALEVEKIVQIEEPLIIGSMMGGGIIGYVLGVFTTKYLLQLTNPLINEENLLGIYLGIGAITSIAGMGLGVYCANKTLKKKAKNLLNTNPKKKEELIDYYKKLHE
jgi:uncharacterized protein YneF (UPF0154 family)